MLFNTSIQYYHHIPLRLIERSDYGKKRAKQFSLNETKESIWIPNRHLHEDGTLIEGEILHYIFRVTKRELFRAGLSTELHYQYSYKPWLLGKVPNGYWKNPKHIFFALHWLFVEVLRLDLTKNNEKVIRPNDFLNNRLNNLFRNYLKCNIKRAIHTYESYLELYSDEVPSLSSK